MRPPTRGTADARALAELMETTSNPWGAVSLFLSVVSIVLAGIAYWRSADRSELHALRSSQQVVVDELRRAIRKGIDDSLARVARADGRLAELRIEAASIVHEAIDALARELEEIKHDGQVVLSELDADVTRGTQAPQETLARRIHYVEGSIRVLTARSEIRAAERLADRGKFAEAENLLEDAVAKVREAKMRLYDDGAPEPAFAPLLETLNEAIRSIRARAADHTRQIDSVLSASDLLLVSLRSHERTNGQATVSTEV
jgi:F0F1-type ATP synthase membrane subunit b/b'